MASKTELINKAITLIGGTPITNITDDTNNARIMNRVYDTSLRALLSECSWNFAIKRTLLATSSDSLAWNDEGVNIVYVRPSDAVRIFRVSDRNATWYEVGDYIVSDTNGLGIEYVQYLDTTSKFPSSFVEALVDRLCSDTAFMVLNDVKIAKAYLEKYKTVSLVDAMAENAQVGMQQGIKDDYWTLAKFGGVGERADLSYG